MRRYTFAFASRVLPLLAVCFFGTSEVARSIRYPASLSRKPFKTACPQRKKTPLCKATSQEAASQEAMTRGLKRLGTTPRETTHVRIPRPTLEMAVLFAMTHVTATWSAIIESRITLVTKTTPYLTTTVTAPPIVLQPTATEPATSGRLTIPGTGTPLAFVSIASRLRHPRLAVLIPVSTLANRTPASIFLARY